MVRFLNASLSEYERRVANSAGRVVSSSVNLDVLASSSATQGPESSLLYLRVFQTYSYSSVCGTDANSSGVTAFGVVRREDDARLYLDVFRHYSRYCVGMQPISSAAVTTGHRKRRPVGTSYATVFQRCDALRSNNEHGPYSRTSSSRATLSRDT